jgi:hypothetical protein
MFAMVPMRLDIVINIVQSIIVLLAAFFNNKKEAVRPL